MRPEAEAEGVDVPAALLMSTGLPTTSTSSTPSRRPSRKVVLIGVLRFAARSARTTDDAQIKKHIINKREIATRTSAATTPTRPRRFKNSVMPIRCLSDVQLRAVYDSDGADATQDVGFEYDPAVFFGALFGSQRFEPFVGELALAQISATLTKGEGAADAAARAMRQNRQSQQVDDEMSKAIGLGLKEVRSHGDVKQRGREVALATTLARGFLTVVCGRRRASFSAWCVNEAHDLAVADHEGLTRGALVLALARGYSCGADEWLGSVDTPLGLGSASSRSQARRLQEHGLRVGGARGRIGVLCGKAISRRVREGPENGSAVGAGAGISRESCPRINRTRENDGITRRLAGAVRLATQDAEIAEEEMNDVDVSMCLEKMNITRRCGKWSIGC